MADKMPSTEAAEQVMNSNSMGFGAGLMPNDPEAKQRLAEMQKVRTGDIFQTGLQGAAMGMQAAQGATNPLAAFVQGMAAGIGAPAQMYQAKQAQIQSAIGAMPFGNVVPEAMDEKSPYYVLRGIPYELASKAIAGIATEVSKATTQADIERKKAEREALMPKKDYKGERDMALDFNKLPEVGEYKGVRSAYRQMNSAPLTIRNEKGEIGPNPAGQMAFMSGYIKMMFPQARQNEGTLSLAEVGSLVDQNTLGLFQKAMSGSLLEKAEVNKLMAAARSKNKSVTKQYQPIAELWGDRAEEQGYNSDFVLSGDYGTGESLEDIYASIKAQYPNMSEPEIFAIMKAQGN
jgi:hypothetical protein